MNNQHAGCFSVTLQLFFPQQHIQFRKKGHSDVNPWFLVMDWRAFLHLFLMTIEMLLIVTGNSKVIHYSDLVQCFFFPVFYIPCQPWVSIKVTLWSFDDAKFTNTTCAYSTHIQMLHIVHCHMFARSEINNRLNDKSCAWCRNKLLFSSNDTFTWTCMVMPVKVLSRAGHFNGEGVKVRQLDLLLPSAARTSPVAPT